MAGYGDDTLFAAWLASNGYTLPAGAPAPAVLRQRGSAYLDGVYGPRFSGSTTAGFSQERAWPRTGAQAHCVDIPTNIVPVAIEQASYFAAYQEAVSPGSLTVVASASSAVKREKIGPIETEYVSGSGNVLTDAVPMLSAIEGLVAPYMTTPLPAILVV